MVAAVDALTSCAETGVALDVAANHEPVQQWLERFGACGDIHGRDLRATGTRSTSPSRHLRRAPSTLVTPLQCDRARRRPAARSAVDAVVGYRERTVRGAARRGGARRGGGRARPRTARRRASLPADRQRAERLWAAPRLSIHVFSIEAKCFDATKQVLCGPNRMFFSNFASVSKCYRVFPNS